MKHTPGPWAWMRDDPRDEPDGISIISHEGDLTWYVAGVTGGLEGGEETREANARLIAAAPDLLDALQGFLDMYVPMVNSGDCGTWDPEKEPEVITARAAIAKATGNG